MKVHRVNNLYGYPALTERIKAWAKANNAQVFVDHLKLSKASGDGLKILIDGPAILLKNNVPLLGYVKMGGTYIKCDLPHPSQLKPNTVKVKVRGNWKRLPTKMFLELMAAPRKDLYLKKMDEKSDEAALVRKMFSRFAPASLNDPWTKPPKIKKVHGKKSGVPTPTADNE